MNDLIKLNSLMWNRKAMDGTWCCAPYPNHPKGCPNFPKCIDKHRFDWTKIDISSLYAVVQEFDLKLHAEHLKGLYPEWTNSQCRCVLYWQPTVNKQLKVKATKYAKELNYNFISTCPEANGINVFGTMAKHGLILYKNPDLVRKIAIIGIINNE